MEPEAHNSSESVSYVVLLDRGVVLHGEHYKLFDTAHIPLPLCEQETSLIEKGFLRVAEQEISVEVPAEVPVEIPTVPSTENSE